MRTQVSSAHNWPNESGSHGSGQSTTQENDPSTYVEYMSMAPASQGQLLSDTNNSADNDGAKETTETGHSYGEGDDGHLTLKFSPNNFKRQCLDAEPLMNDLSSAGDADVLAGSPQGSQFDATDVASHNIAPHTPAPKVFFLNRGSIMAPSQLFGETQPSAARGLQGNESVSSRPSPALFLHVRNQLRDLSSPLNQFAEHASDGQSSPFHSEPPRDQCAHEEFADNTSPGDPRLESSLAVTVMEERNILEPQEYISHRESDQRRNPLDNQADDSDVDVQDVFEDAKAERMRIAKKRKHEAIRDLAHLPETNTPEVLATDLVEVPSTSNGRRRSEAEEYIAQCLGEDARDTEQDVTIADSQTCPSLRRSVSSQGGHENSQEIQLDDDTGKINGLSFTVHAAVTDQTPSISKAVASNFGKSFDEPSDFSTRQFNTEPLGVCSGNKRETGTPCQSVAVPGEIIPETSPLEAHQRIYAFDSQSPALASSHDVSRFDNPLTPDDEFRALMTDHSPLPSRPLHNGRITADKYRKQNQSSSLLKKDVLDSTLITMSSGRSSKKSYIQSPRLESIAKGSTSTKLQAQPADATEPGASNAIASSSNKIILGASTSKARYSSEESGLSQAFAVRGSADSNKKMQRKHIETNSYDTSNLETPCTSKRNEVDSTRSTRSSTRIFAAQQTQLTEASLVKHLEIEAKSSSTAREQSLRLGGIGLLGTKSSSSALTSLQSSERTTSIEPEGLGTHVASRLRKAPPTIDPSESLFKQMAFSVSYAQEQDEEKQRVLRHIRKNGGQILEGGFDKLFKKAVMMTPRKRKETDLLPDGSLLALTEDAKRVTFSCILAGQYSRKTKYMQALALCLPCISGVWIEHCVSKGRIIDWEPYMLAAGESSFLGGAIRSRTLATYPAQEASFEHSFESRKLLLGGKSILMITTKSSIDGDKERQQSYLFLTQLLGPRRIKRVKTNLDARNALLVAEGDGDPWDLIYVDNDKTKAETSIFANSGSNANGKRKRASTPNHGDGLAPKLVKIITAEYLIQSLILGRLIDSD